MMGEYAELELERLEHQALINEDPYLNWFLNNKRQPQKIVWVTKDNKYIEIKYHRQK